METVRPSIAPEDAWSPLPSAEWDAAAARHLLRRTAFSAQTADVDAALEDGAAATIERLFQPSPALEPPPSLAKLDIDTPEFFQKARAASEEERRTLRQMAQERGRIAYEDYGIRWLQRAANRRYSAYEKFVLFLQDVFVVSFEKVKNPALLLAHQQVLRAGGVGSYPDLCKAVLRSPAMVMYLDLQQSRAGHPNENFARELFELFTLGEGNYTEDDIKEAARAFTGYRQRFGTFAFVRREHDTGEKHVFGKTGAFTGDDVIDLVFTQPAAARFLPGELARFYLTEKPLPPPYLEALGGFWRADGFNTAKLLARFFGSRLFFAPEFRAEMIKSPVHYYIGLLQDLGLDVAPFPRITMNFQRQMGQPFFSPPNVRGWVGGPMWINSSTLGARRSLVEFLFAPLDVSRLNADEQAALAAAQTDGELHLTVDDARLAGLDVLEPAAAARQLLDTFFPVRADEAFAAALTAQIAAARGDARNPAARLRQIEALLVQAPQYHLC